MNEDAGIPEMVRLEDVVNSLRIPVMILDEDMTILKANDSTAESTGISREDLCGMSTGKALQCIHVDKTCGGGKNSDNCRQCAIRTTVEESFRLRKNIWQVEGKVVLEGRGERDFLIFTRYMPSCDKVLLSLFDSTRYRALEKARLEKGRLLAAVETAGAICHEMNQPLQVVSGYIDIMRLKNGDSHPVQEFIEEIRNQLERLKCITARLNSLTHYRTRDYMAGSKILDIERSARVEEAGGMS